MSNVAAGARWPRVASLAARGSHVEGDEGLPQVLALREGAGAAVGDGTAWARERGQAAGHRALQWARERRHGSAAPGHAGCVPARAHTPAPAKSRMTCRTSAAPAPAAARRQTRAPPRPPPPLSRPPVGAPPPLQRPPSETPQTRPPPRPHAPQRGEACAAAPAVASPAECRSERAVRAPRALAAQSKAAREPCFSVKESLEPLELAAARVCARGHAVGGTRVSDS